jgi:hypothetical protein
MAGENEAAPALARIVPDIEDFSSEDLLHGSNAGAGIWPDSRLCCADTR